MLRVLSIRGVWNSPFHTITHNTDFSFLIFSFLELLPESQFNVELVVQCVRLSSSPQTHRHALLLLSTAAPVYPVSVSDMH